VDFALALLCWLPACCALLALYEYAGHRWALHHPWFSRRLGLGHDHRMHHKVFARFYEGPHEEPSWYDPVWVRGLFGLLWSFPVVVVLFFFVSTPLAAALLVSAPVHGAFWQWIHNQMHRPTAGWFNRCGYFVFVRDFHCIHHGRPRTNFGFVFAPLMDRLFGTYVRPAAKSHR
jgi:hypothetical protein